MIKLVFVQSLFDVGCGDPSLEEEAFGMLEISHLAQDFKLLVGSFFVVINSLDRMEHVQKIFLGQLVYVGCLLKWVLLKG